MIPDDAEEVLLTEMDPQQERSRSHGQDEDDEDEEQMGGPRVACASQ